ncbi:hypothetical protein ACFE04_031573 [Oxalis oulophora]
MMLSSLRKPLPLLNRIQTLFISTQPISQSLNKPQKPHQNPPKFDSTTVTQTLSSYNNDHKRALEFFNWVEKDCYFTHTTETYNRIIDILGKFFEFDASWDLIHRMNANPLSVPNHTTFRIMFRRYVSAHMVNEAIGTCGKLGEFGLSDEVSYCNLIDALCEYKHVVEAQELCFGKDKVVEFDGFRVSDTKIHNMILRGWFKMGWWSKCREFWEEMDRKGVSKDLHSYSIYMDIMCKSGKPWKAVKLYKDMKSKHMKLDVVVYNTALRAIGLADGVGFAIRVYRGMRESGCEPDVVTYNTIIKLLCENGRVREAHTMLDEMAKKGCTPDEITYHCFFGILEKPEEILKMFDRMIEIGAKPRMATYVMLMRKFGRWGFLRPVFIVWDKMEELGQSPDYNAYNALIDALIKKGMIDTAKKYDEEMLAKGISSKRRRDLGSMLMLGSSDGG